jgi:hypothetical protein
MRTGLSLAVAFVRYAAFAALAMLAGPAVANDKPADTTRPGESAKTAAKGLCDDNWEGGFWTIEVDRLKNDGRTSVRKPYDPQKPLAPWFAPEGSYLRMGYFQDPDSRNKGLPASFIIKMVGRFYDRKEAEALRKKMPRDVDLSVHLNPRYPPYVSAPGAYLASEKYTCTLNKENDTLTKASWIVELDGHLFAGAESACKDDKKRKTVSIVDCEGKKTLATDSWTSPCESSQVQSCLFPLAPGWIAIRQDYSTPEEGRQTSFRVYDLARGKQTAKFTGGGDWEAGGGSFCSFEDTDGDGIPEITNSRCEDDKDCKVVRTRKWNKDRFVDVKPKK